MSFIYKSDINQVDNNIPKNLSTTAGCFISYALKIGALKLSSEGVKLKSKRISPYFFNSGLFNHGEDLIELHDAYATTAQKLIKEKGVSFDVVYGPAYKGITLASGVAQLLYLRNNLNTGYAFNRKEEKDHGEGGSLVGASLNKKKVLLIDDVITKGTSSGEAMDIIQTSGGIPVGCIIAFDRQEVGIETSLSAVQEFENKYSIPV